MEKALFKSIVESYTKIADECTEFVKLFDNDFDLETLTIKEFKKLIEKARNLHSKTDKILQSELYHILGMGNLTVVQTQKLCALIKTISSARSYFKPICGYVLNELPEVPDKSLYKCDVAGIKLTVVFS